LVPAELILNDSDRQAIADGCYFEDQAWRRVAHFLETFCCLSKGEWGGKPIVLIPWQIDLLKRLYGWRTADGRRRFKEVYVEIPKKNGKSALLSGLVLYHLVADGEMGAEVYICAYTSKQAGIIFDEAVNMVQSSPSLARILDVKDSFHCKEIHYRKTRSKLVALSSDAPGADGPSASFVAFDELHRQDTPDMFRVMRYSGLARKQRVFMSITTAGENKDSICYQQHEYAEKVNGNIIVDTAFLGIVYGLKEDDDIDDPANWRKANPGFGYILEEDDLRRELAQAKEDPTELNNFLRLRLNIWVQGDCKFIDMTKWSVIDKPFDLSILDGKTCWGGCDLASVDDTSAYALLFDVDGVYYVLVWFWLPEDNAPAREKRLRIPILQWSKDDRNNLTLTPGDVIDYSFLEKTIVETCNKYQVRMILCDPHNATQFVLDLQAQGVPIDFIKQNNAVMNSPMQMLKVLISQGKIRTGGNKMLTWQASNAIAVADGYGLTRLGKGKKREKVDGIQAILNALAVAMVECGTGEPSITVLESD
jgi:phage terminase large subunit-like protein